MYFLRISNQIKVKLMPSNEDKIDKALYDSLRNTIKRRYPEHWKEIVKCIEAAINTGLEGDALEEQIDKCLQNITVVTPEDRDHLKKTPRSHITVGGG